MNNQQNEQNNSQQSDNILIVNGQLINVIEPVQHNQHTYISPWYTSSIEPDFYDLNQNQ